MHEPRSSARPDRRPRRCGHRAAAVLAVAFASATSSCSVAANLSADEIMTEVDAIVGFEGSGRDRELVYRTRAEVSAWYTRMFLLQPLRLPLILAFGRTSESELDNPTAHVRELLAELPDEVEDDLLPCAKAMIRLGWIGQLEKNAHSRLVALDGMATIARALELPVFTGDFARFGELGDPDLLAAARAGVQMARPDARPSTQRDPEALQAYVAALERLTAAPLDTGPARLTLLEEVATLYDEEPIAALRPALAKVLHAAMANVLEMLLADTVRDRASERVDLRLCAMQHVRSLGGPRAVPLLLALMVADPAAIARGESYFDPDPAIQLRLVHYCGQLRGELAEATVRLPGYQGHAVFSPLDFLAVTILTDTDYYPKLRLPALVAMTWSLQRPQVDPDPAWVRSWREQRR